MDKTQLQYYSDKYNINEDAVRLACLLPNYNPFLHAEDCYIDLEIIERKFQIWENHIKQIDGKEAGRPFPLADWQWSVLFNLYGWRRPDGRRRYNKVFIYVPKKNGKSAWTAGIIVVEIVDPEEASGEIYSAAAAQKQTNNVFKHVKGMVLKDEWIGENLRVYGGNVGGTKSVVNEENDCTYKCLAADAGTVDGLHPTLNVIDELHRHKNAELSEVLDKSTSGRFSPLTIYTTTADEDRPSECNNMLRYARSVCANLGDPNQPGYAPNFLPVVYEVNPADYKDDKLFWTREEVWRKANPNLGKTVTVDQFKEMTREALEIPSKLNNFLRLHLNIVTGQGESWMDMTKYDACKARNPLDFHKGNNCYAALDMSSTTDITAYGLSFKVNDDEIDHYGWYWIPEDKALYYEKQLGIPFSQWRDAGYVEFIPGDYVDDEVVYSRIQEINEGFQVDKIMLDEWNALGIINRMIKDGVKVEAFRQGYKSMNYPMKQTEKLVKAGKFRHGDNPCLRWQFSNVVFTTDDAENIKPSKKKSEQKIDGAVVAIMSIAPHFPMEDEQEQTPCIDII